MSMSSVVEFLNAVLLNTRNLGLYVHLTWMTYIMFKASQGVHLIFFALVSALVTISVIVFLKEKDKDKDKDVPTL